MPTPSDGSYNAPVIPELGVIPSPRGSQSWGDPAVVVLKIVSIDGLRPGAQAGDRDDAIFNSGIDDDWCDARHVDEFRLYDTQRDARRDTRVDRVAARL